MTFWEQWLRYVGLTKEGGDRIQPIAIGNERLRLKVGTISLKPV
jgi:hypothetical protein